MKLSDYLVQYLVDHKVKDVFIVMGGAASHIVDSLGKNKKIIPKLAAIKTAKGYVAKPIEDQLPYLKRSVLRENMLINTIE